MTCTCLADPLLPVAAPAEAWTRHPTVEGLSHARVAAWDGTVCEQLLIYPPLLPHGSAPVVRVFHPDLIALCPEHGVPPLHAPSLFDLVALAKYHGESAFLTTPPQWHAADSIFPLFADVDGRIYTEPRQSFHRIGYIRPPYIYTSAGGQLLQENIYALP